VQHGCVGTIAAATVQGLRRRWPELPILDETSVSPERRRRELDDDLRKHASAEGVPRLGGNVVGLVDEEVRAPLDHSFLEKGRTPARHVHVGDDDVAAFEQRVDFLHRLGTVLQDTHDGVEGLVVDDLVALQNAQGQELEGKLVPQGHGGNHDKQPGKSLVHQQRQHRLRLPGACRHGDRGRCIAHGPMSEGVVQSANLRTAKARCPGFLVLLSKVEPPRPRRPNVLANLLHATDRGRGRIQVTRSLPAASGGCLRVGQCLQAPGSEHERGRFFIDWGRSRRHRYRRLALDLQPQPVRRIFRDFGLSSPGRSCDLPDTISEKATINLETSGKTDLPSGHAVTSRHALLTILPSGLIGFPLRLKLIISCGIAMHA